MWNFVKTVYFASQDIEVRGKSRKQRSSHRATELQLSFDEAEARCVKLKVPEDWPPSLRIGCSIIDVRYSVHVRIELSCDRCLWFSAPVEIGTVPLGLSVQATQVWSGQPVQQLPQPTAPPKE